MTTSGVTNISTATHRFPRTRAFLAWLRRITTPHPGLTDPEDRRRARLLANLSFSLAVLLGLAFLVSVFTSIFFPDPSISLGVPGTVLILINALGFSFAFRRSLTPQYKIGAWIAIFFVFLTLSGFIVLYPKLSFALVLGYGMPVLFATIFLSSSGTIRVFVLALLTTIAALLYLQVSIVNFSFAIGIMLAVTILIVLVAFLREEDLTQVKRLREAEAAEGERLRRELELARKVQLSMLPKSLPELPSLELAAYSQPAFEASGDFYDLFPLNHLGGQSEKLGIVVCDVAGKGVSSALIMSATRAALRAEAENNVSPGKVLRKVNEMLAESVPAGLFVTIFYGIYDLATRELCYASAGHPHPYYWNGQSVSELENFGMPLGLVAESDYDDQVARLAPGDSVFIYTDGLVEALNVRREMYGFESVQKNVALYAAQASAKDMVRSTIRDMETFMDGERPQDDVTVVVLRLKQLVA